MFKEYVDDVFFVCVGAFSFVFVFVLLLDFYSVSRSKNRLNAISKCNVDSVSTAQVVQARN